MAEQTAQYALGVTKEFGTAVFFFDILTDESVSLQADITDNFVETNYSVQDHIAIKPRTVRLKGLVGEVTWQDYHNQPDLDLFLEKQLEIARTQNGNFLDTIANMTMLNGLFPTLGNYTNSAVKISNQIMSSYDRYKGIYTQFRRLKSKNDIMPVSSAYEESEPIKQKQVLDKLTQIFNERLPVSLVNMAYYEAGNEIDNALWHIQAINIRQSDSAYISDLEISLKEVRIAQTKYTKVNEKTYANSTDKTQPANNNDVSKAPTNPQELKQVIEKKEQEAKENTKNALSKHPVIKGLVKGIYFGIKKIGETGIQGTGLR